MTPWQRACALVMVVAAAPLAPRAAGESPAERRITHRTFLDFNRGRLGDGGANSYLAADGSVRLINRWDLNGDGHLDLVFPSSHDNNQGIDSYVYWGSGRFDPARRTALPGDGASGCTVADLNRDGFPDLVLANEFNGTKTELASYVYWGSKAGYAPARRTELPTVAATAVTAADLDGDGWPELVFASTGQSYQFSKAGGDFQFLRPVSDVYWGSASGYSPKRVTQLETFHARAVAVADLDRDGHPDIVFANQGQDAATSGVLVYWGSAGGTYSKERRLQLPGIGSAGVAVADCNGDGWLDLAVANERRPVADPEFAKQSDLPIPSYLYWGGPAGFDASRRTELPAAAARDVKVADLDRDGFPDVVLACAKGAASVVYWGAAGPRGGFEPGRRSALPTSHASRAAVADLDGDGRLDLVFANQDDGRTNEVRSVIYWNGPAGFAAARKTELPTLGAYDVAAADLDGDARIDLFFANNRDGMAGAPTDTYIYWGNPRGAYSAAARQTLSGDGLTAASAADLDNDGYAELLTVGKELRIYRGGPAGYSHARSYTLPVHYAFSTRVADFDRDGYLDLSVADWWGDNARDRTLIYWGGPGGFSADNRFTFPFAGARAHTAADFDGNGYLDLLFTGSNSEVAIFWNGPAGFDPRRKTVLPAKLAVSAEVADLNRDGFLDIVVCNLYDLDRVEHPAVMPDITAPPQTATFAAGTSIFWGSRDGYAPDRRLELPTVGSEDAAIADLNRDGFLDLVITSYHAGITRNHPSYVFWGGEDGISPARVTELPTESASGVQVADFNHDGWRDILFACHTEGTKHRTNSFLYWGGKQGFSPARRLLVPSKGTHWMWVTDIGNVRDRSDAFDYVSAPIDLGAGSRPGTLAWRAATPLDTAVKLQLRAAETAGELERAPWAGPEGPGGSYTVPGTRIGSRGRWVQYKATLVAPNGAGAPVLQSVTITTTHEEK